MSTYGVQFSGPRLPIKPPIQLPAPKRVRVEHKQLKAASLEIRAAAMRNGVHDWEIGMSARIGIARELLKLQSQGLLRVWVEQNAVFVGPHMVTTGGVQRRRLRWSDAQRIADNPDRYLPGVLRAWA